VAFIYSKIHLQKNWHIILNLIINNFINCLAQNYVPSFFYKFSKNTNPSVHFDSPPTADESFCSFGQNWNAIICFPSPSFVPFIRGHLSSSKWLPVLKKMRSIRNLPSFSNKGHSQCFFSLALASSFSVQSFILINLYYWG
jgi:hypothetical protein